jgi:hypothetical protein
MTTEVVAPDVEPSFPAVSLTQSSSRRAGVWTGHLQDYRHHGPDR